MPANNHCHVDTLHSTNKTRAIRQFAAVALICAGLLPGGFGAANAGAPSAFVGQLQADWLDEFDAASLDPVWYWVSENPSGWSLTEQPGFLRTYTSPYATGDENLLLRSVEQGDFVMQTRLLFEPNTNFQFAGLVIYQDQLNYLQFGRAFCDLADICVGNGIYFDRIEDGRFVDGNFATSTEIQNEAFLRLERRGSEISAYYSVDGISWTLIGVHAVLGGFAVNAVGLTASQNYNSADSVPADFDYFALKPLPSPTSLPSTVPTRMPVPAASPTPTPLPGYIPHRIGVRQVDGAGEFYDRLTGEKFVPRGYNYIRLSPIFGTSGQMWEETLNPGFYDTVLAEEALRQMHANGYNVVRVVVDCCRPSSNVGSRTDGISAAYIDNVVDFLNKAKANDIFVLLVLHLTPADGPYNQLWYGYDKKVFDGLNLFFLTTGGFEAKAWYDQDFIRALIEREAPLDAVFAYDLTDVLYFDTDSPPFTLHHGLVPTANGKSYDMAKPEDRQRMMEENLASWIDQQRAAILEVDPTALVTESVWVFRPDSRPTQPEAVWRSTADFVDLHVFLGPGRTWSDYERLFDEVDQAANAGMDEKPVIIGKFAAFGYGSGPSAAQALVQWQSASCQHGVDGWLLADYVRLSSDREIDNALAPVNRPDPCQPLSITESVQGYLVFLPMGLASAAVLIALVYTARSRSRRISTVAGFLLAAPCALMGVLFSGFVFSQPVGSLLCGLPPLVFGAGLGYLLGKRWEADTTKSA